MLAVSQPLFVLSGMSGSDSMETKRVMPNAFLYVLYCSVLQLGITGRLGLDRKQVGSAAEQLRLRDSMLADLRAQNKALAGDYLTHACALAEGLQRILSLGAFLTKKLSSKTKKQQCILACLKYGCG